MEFNTKINGGHRGARKFWREMLPRIKYRNPSIPIEIIRHNDPAGPAKLYIYTTSLDPTPSNPPKPETTPQPTPTVASTITAAAPTYTIDIRMIQESQILTALIEATGARVIEATEQEKEEIRDMEEFKERSEKDRQEVREKFLAGRREEELLKLARGEVASVA
ncbi:uncharacterized protein BDR25DRAFT_286772 [Lindgomyces ingoldianus]|uniref:Uncharacterized protein n=1 Tax=Lindgomyces ingoldianus TaxID=673940 RepID=A0ACB6QX44_9PLEO|nr:uncharacterized protein BDR25DRAFT_286772 [Lindgomyces ingoldianus]KAF2470647.1 hypothetical protein BDR25DRAFT_286772 [Lindgomyces ingoldianus]